jgi:hypothetical protein
VILIKLSVQSTEKEVDLFLSELRTVITARDFNPYDDLIVIRSHKPREKEEFSTPYTLLSLEYDSDDIAERLRELTAADYSETLIDTDDTKPPLLFVFGKDIGGRQVYIKLKIKGNAVKHILCVSFHYAERRMIFPFI